MHCWRWIGGSRTHRLLLLHPVSNRAWSSGFSGKVAPVHIGRLGPVSASWLFSIIDGHAIGISRFEDQRVSLLVVRDCGTGADIISAADSKLFSKFTGEVIEVIWDTSASSS